MIRDKDIEKEISVLEEKLQKIKDELEEIRESVPKGTKLRAFRHNYGFQYYVRRLGERNNGKYIKSRDIKLALVLAQIEYDEKLSEKLQEKIEVLMLCKECGMNSFFETVLEQMSPGKQVLVHPHFTSDKDFINQWSQQKYEGLPFKEGYPEYYTRKGLRVRSKSEVIIADILDELSIPFLYEKPLQLKKKTVHPDFTLLNIKERNEVYWEHFGMMDDRDYRDEALLKIREYEANGLYQHNSVIWTFESGKYPINTRDIRKMIKNICDALGY